MLNNHNGGIIWDGILIQRCIVEAPGSGSIEVALELERAALTESLHQRDGDTCFKTVSHLACNGGGVAHREYTILSR